jgi:hypothetical protein
MAVSGKIAAQRPADKPGGPAHQHLRQRVALPGLIGRQIRRRSGRKSIKQR